MAIQFVGQVSVGGTGATLVADLTTLTSGIASSPSAGDLIVCNTGIGSNADYAMSMVTTGYTVVAELNSADSRDTNQLVTWKLSTGDISVEVNGSNDTQAGANLIVTVWRGVDQVTPIDATSTSATGINESLANCPAITPVTAGAVVLSLTQSTDDATPTAFNTPADRDINFFQHTAHGGTNRGCVGTSGASSWVSGPLDPAALTGGTSTSFDSWAAVTMALRPGGIPSSLASGLSSMQRAHLRTLLAR